MSNQISDQWHRPAAVLVLQLFMYSFCFMTLFLCPGRFYSKTLIFMRCHMGHMGHNSNFSCIFYLEIQMSWNLPANAVKTLNSFYRTASVTSHKASKVSFTIWLFNALHCKNSLMREDHKNPRKSKKIKKIKIKENEWVRITSKGLEDLWCCCGVWRCKPLQRHQEEAHTPF